MSLISIIQDAAVELGFAEPSVAITSTDLAVKQMVVLADKEGKELARRFDWQRLMTEGTFTATASATQVASIATTYPNFARIINGTMWNRTQNRVVKGPLTAAEWQRMNAATARVTIGNYFRIRGNGILFFSTPASGDEIFFEYCSDKWCQGALATAQSAWAADADTALIDEEIIRLGVVWRYKKSKGFDYGEDFRTYEMALQDVFGIDAGKSPVDMTGDENLGLGVNLAEGSWDL
jgi:hypothetical protein